MMQALLNGSDEELKKVTSKPTFTYLTNQVARLARKLVTFDNSKVQELMNSDIGKSLQPIDIEDEHDYPQETKQEPIDLQDGPALAPAQPQPTPSSGPSPTPSPSQAPRPSGDSDLM